MTDGTLIIPFKLKPEHYQPSGWCSNISYADPLRDMQHYRGPHSEMPRDQLRKTLSRNIEHLDRIIARFDLTKIERPAPNWENGLPWHDSSVTEKNVWAVVDYRAGFQAELVALAEKNEKDA